METLSQVLLEKFDREKKDMLRSMTYATVPV
jgi:hypothetical protein